LLSSAIVARVLRISESIGKAMKWPWCCNYLICFPPVHHIHEVCLKPTLNDFSMLSKAGKPFGVVKELIDKSLHRKLVTPFQTTGEPVVGKSREKGC